MMMESSINSATILPPYEEEFETVDNLHWSPETANSIYLFWIHQLQASIGVNTTVLQKPAHLPTSCQQFFQRHMNQIRQSLKEKDIVAAVDVRYDTPASEFPQFIHSLDTWHKAKSIAKRLAETSKKAASKELIPWIRKIINLFWYCCHVSKGSVDRLTRRWFGILYHVTNVHSWVTDRCRHRENEIIDDPSRSWLNKSSTAYKNLRSIITDKYFLGNLKYYTRCRQTWCIENFYSHSLLKYCPKRIGFSFDGYVMRNQLAIIDYNHHTGRPALTNSQDEVCGMPQFSRKTKHWVAYERLVCKSYDYIPDLMSECMYHIYRARNEDYKKGKRSLELDDIAPNLSGESNPETTSNLLKEMKRRKSEDIILKITDKNEENEDDDEENNDESDAAAEICQDEDLQYILLRHSTSTLRK
ncbi:hypothetical protein LOTGIDRAFT_175811 [Lottia gigantea]|uniref:Uncharacterized protein n=1 Tax=Lottia gigantea TaxID=225164 RepID=V3ZHI8_LOTGI|nr:hypothetical protein LOTGIDRAFT_175811 [Lottia gigantea]ESO90733.1 hypothetical protein LOTGIDRAFT_175811 [Lottia gigantea]